MPESVKKVVETKKIPAVKKTIQKKKPAVAIKPNTTKVATTITTDTTTDAKPNLTQGEKLLKSMTAQKTAKKALMKGVATTHVSFDDEGNEAHVETVIKKTAPISSSTTTNKNRPVVKKPEPKKRKAIVEDVTEKKEENNKKPPPKKVKKPKKSKIEIEEEKKDNKQEEALAYVRLFVNNRDYWKFKKVQQIWLLSNLYNIPEDEFDNVLEYLKDLQGSAREKAKKEAEKRIPTPLLISNTLTGYANVNSTNDDDDFDAEKLLAAAATTVAATIEEEDETLEIKRAKLIINVLG